LGLGAITPLYPIGLSDLVQGIRFLLVKSHRRVGTMELGALK